MESLPVEELFNFSADFNLNLESVNSFLDELETKYDQKFPVIPIEKKVEQVKLSCIFCKQVNQDELFDTLEKLNAHMDICLNNPALTNFECNICGLKFQNNKNNYALHIPKCRFRADQQKAKERLKKEKDQLANELRVQCLKAREAKIEFQKVNKYIATLNEARLYLPYLKNKESFQSIISEMKTLLDTFPQEIVKREFDYLVNDNEY